MSVLLVFGMFVVGFWLNELLAAISKQPALMFASFFYGIGFACIGAWVVFK